VIPRSGATSRVTRPSDHLVRSLPPHFTVRTHVVRSCDPRATLPSCVSFWGARWTNAGAFGAQVIIRRARQPRPRMSKIIVFYCCISSGFLKKGGIKTMKKLTFCIAILALLVADRRRPSARAFKAAQCFRTSITLVIKWRLSWSRSRELATLLS
jgi:hypothetical protein